MTQKSTVEKKPRRSRSPAPEQSAPSPAKLNSDADSDTDTDGDSEGRLGRAARLSARHDDADAFIPVPGETHRRVPDDLAEYLGEGFVQSATSGDDLDSQQVDAVQPEEIGGPFIETDADTEFGGELDPPQSRTAGPSGRSADSSSDAEWEGPTLAEAFPTAVRGDIDPARSPEDAGLPGADAPDDAPDDNDGDDGDEEEDEDAVAPSDRDASLR